MKEKVCSTFLAERMYFKGSPQVDVCGFASDQTVQELLKETEDHFTTRFGGHILMATQ
jgi:glutaredoxin-related protein